MSPHLIFAMFMLAPICSGHISSQNTQDNPRIYCGRALARVIADMCYKQKEDNKRSGSGTMYGDLLLPYYNKEEDTRVTWPWMPTSKARTLGSTRGKRIMSGVADECCDKPCSVEELLSYCYY